MVAQETGSQAWGGMAHVYVQVSGTPGALGVSSGSGGEAPIAAFPKPPSLKARAPGRIKGSGQKGSKAVQRHRETEDEVSSHIQGEGFHLPAFESGAKVGKVTTRLKFKWCRMGRREDETPAVWPGEQSQGPAWAPGCRGTHCRVPGRRGRSPPLFHWRMEVIERKGEPRRGSGLNR